MALIKKKDVNSYFAARKGRHPLRVQPASSATASGPSKLEHRKGGSDSPGVIGVAESAALPLNPRVATATGHPDTHVEKKSAQV